MNSSSAAVSTAMATARPSSLKRPPSGSSGTEEGMISLFGSSSLAETTATVASLANSASLEVMGRASSSSLLLDRSERSRRDFFFLSFFSVMRENESMG